MPLDPEHGQQTHEFPHSLWEGKECVHLCLGREKPVKAIPNYLIVAEVGTQLGWKSPSCVWLRPQEVVQLESVPYTVGIDGDWGEHRRVLGHFWVRGERKGFAEATNHCFLQPLTWHDPASACYG